MPLKLISQRMAIWKNAFRNLLWYILWKNSLFYVFITISCCGGIMVQSQMTCGQSWMPWECLLEACLKHSLWDTTVTLYIQTDHCSNQCWGNAWDAWALDVQEGTPGLLMKWVQNPCKWLPNWGSEILSGS